MNNPYAHGCFHFKFGAGGRKQAREKETASINLWYSR